MNQKVSGKVQLMFSKEGGEFIFNDFTYLILSKADPNKLLYFLQKPMDISQVKDKKSQNFPLDSHFSFLGNGINLASIYQTSDNVDKVKSLSLYTWENTPYKKQVATRVVKSRYLQKTIFINEIADYSKQTYTSEFYISNIDKGDLIHIKDGSFKTREFGLHNNKADTCVIGIIDPNTQGSKEPFKNLFFLHKG